MDLTLSRDGSALCPCTLIADRQVTTISGGRRRVVAVVAERAVAVGEEVELLGERFRVKQSLRVKAGHALHLEEA